MIELRRPAVMSVLLVAAVCGGCGMRRDTRPRTARAETPAPTTELRDALLSVYFHAYLVRDERPPRLPEGHPMRLDRAAKVIARDESFGASSRRRRSIGKLGAAYQLLTAPPGRHVPLTPADVRNALQVLGAPPSVVAEGSAAPPSFADLEQALYAKLDAAPSVTYAATCCACIMSCETFDAPNTAKARFTIQVGRDVSELKEVTDPLEWTRCNSLYFTETTYAGADCPTAKAGGVKGPTPNSGDPWSGVLFEHYSNSGVDLTNLLDICTDPPQPQGGRALKYTLCQAKSGTAALTEDCGTASAYKDPSTSGTFHSRLTGLKILRFQNLSPGTIAMEAMVDEIAQVAVCCDLHEPDCACGPETCSLAGGGKSAQNALPNLSCPAGCP